MKKVFNVTLFVILTLMLVACGQTTSGEQGRDTVSFRLATPDPESSPITEAANEFAKVVEEKSEGSIEISVHPNGTLYGGDASAAVKQLGEGSLDMLVLSTSLYANFEPKFNAISIPYLFDGADQFTSFLNSDLAEELLKNTKDELGIEGLGLWSREFRQITNSLGPITEPEDLDGVKLRVPNNPLWVEFFGGAGTATTPMDFSEVYNALQLGTIDGQENPLGVILSSNIHEVQDYLTISNHMAEAWVVGVNEDKFSNLTEEQQQILREATEEVQEWKVDNDASNAERIIEELVAQGIEINEITSEQQEEFVKVSQEAYPTFKKLVKNDEFFNQILEFVGKDE
ncbi:DctP family TRAP transporter solute-binding subunit [Oceanobacillus alkalisoli]|uniref:DctP family TRAP transporter solute-binding subunit n=1 Tax=Oceanobacillus alkalisoli TaxID=2925113 RepID=UPI001F11DE77|nr:DctP family TRAP transporter solute-binding subunit [Oceanobacillus alkalisoli]MCF3942578.1 DctP family TRAP transporter solute-binding subunit [Oceanobacillus alkalisoli]